MEKRYTISWGGLIIDTQDKFLYISRLKSKFLSTEEIHRFDNFPWVEKALKLEGVRFDQQEETPFAMELTLTRQGEGVSRVSVSIVGKWPEE